MCKKSEECAKTQLIFAQTRLNPNIYISVYQYTFFQTRIHQKAIKEEPLWTALVNIATIMSVSTLFEEKEQD